MTSNSHLTSNARAIEIAPLHNAEAEEAVIGSVLLDCGLYPLINLRAEDFFIHRWRFIWDAFTSLRKRKMAIDYLTVIDELERQNTLAEIGGAAALTAVISRVVSAYNVESYAKIVLDNSVRRRQLEVANTIAIDAVNGGVDVAQIIDMLSQAGHTGQSGRMIRDGVDELFDATSKRSEDPRDVWGIPTGFIDLDKRTGGLHAQQTFMLSGAPEAGKTTLMLQTALHAAKNNHGVAIFELEMDEQRCLRRLVELLTGVPNRAMLTGRMDRHWPSFLHAIEELRELPIYINADPGMTTGKMQVELARLQSQHSIGLVCLDYLNLLGDVAGDGNNSNTNTAIKAQRFRRICREQKVSGMSIQDMTKAGWDAIVPKLSGMAGPAAVHYGADIVFFLAKSPDEINVYHLIPAKQRDGDSGSAAIPLSRPGLGFCSLTYRDGPESPMYPKAKV